MRSKQREALGEQQLEVLRFVADHAPITVGEVAEQFGGPQGLARTTILTVMERLREKGYLTRAKRGGVFHYSPAIAKTELLHNLVENFVEKTLQGSISPFVAYLANSKELSGDEVAALKQVIQEFEELEKGTPETGKHSG